MRLERQRECEWLFWLGKVFTDWGATDDKPAQTTLRIPGTAGIQCRCSEVSASQEPVFTKQEHGCRTSCGSLGSSKLANVVLLYSDFYSLEENRADGFEIQSAHFLKIAFTRKAWSRETENCIC